MSSENYNANKPGPCCQKIDDMIGYAEPLIQKWPAFYKYTLGERIMDEMLTMLRLATKARLRYMNKSTLADLDTSKEVLKAFVRRANNTVFQDRSGKERRLLTDHRFGVWSRTITEIGCLIGGWMNSVSDRKSNK